MEKNEACLICGGKIEYYSEKIEKKCQICGEAFMTNACCEKGHYVCDRCHSRKALERAAAICREEASVNPVEILTKLMRESQVHMHGPEHHVLTGMALLTACVNCGGYPRENFGEGLLEISSRGGMIPGGSCGFLGICGAAAGAGAFMSLITETTPMSTESWKVCAQVSARVLDNIAGPGGPRCCKRSSYIAVLTAAEMAEEELNIKMKTPETVSCEFYKENKECIRGRCPFFPEKSEGNI